MRPGMSYKRLLCVQCRPHAHWKNRFIYEISHGFYLNFNQKLLQDLSLKISVRVSMKIPYKIFCSKS